MGFGNNRRLLVSGFEHSPTMVDHTQKQQQERLLLYALAVGFFVI
jgi:hypothetical protein